MATEIKELQCGDLSASQAGDYFQVVFEKAAESDEGYLLLQPQFDNPRGVECYIETEDIDFCGHYRVHNASLSRSRFFIRYGDGDLPTMEIRVSFEETDAAYAEGMRLLRSMIPHLEVTE